MYFLQYYISISIKNIMVMVILGIVIVYEKQYTKLIFD